MKHKRVPEDGQDALALSHAFVQESVGWIDDEEVADALTEILLAIEAGRRPTREGIARKVAMSPRNLHRRFLAAGIGKPSDWIALLRVLPVVIYLDTHEHSTVREAARLFGFPTTFGMSNMMDRLGGVRPSARLPWPEVASLLLAGVLPNGGGVARR